MKFANERDEARSLVELIDEAINRGDSDRLRAIVGHGTGAEMRELADVVISLEALRERIWIYRISRQLRGDESAGGGDEDTPTPTPKG